MSTTALRPFFTYFGGKWRIAPKYPLPQENTIIEPFAGSAGYAVRYANRKVVLIDANPVICGVWNYLIHATETEILELPLWPAFDSIHDLTYLPQEARWLIGFWLSKGTTHPRPRPSTFLKRGDKETSHWGEAIRYRIASQLWAIRHWNCICADFPSSSWDRLGDSSVTWFIDPPYQQIRGHYPYDTVDYAAIELFSTAAAGQVIVCESLGADWLPFNFHLSNKTTEGRNHTNAANKTEMIWTNRGQQS